MTNNIESELKNFDYSVFSKVKDSLLEELLQKQRMNKFKNFSSLSQRLSAEAMSDDEVDMVAAAGTTVIKKDEK